MRAIKIVGVVVLAWFLTGCITTTERVYTETEEIIYHPPRPAPVRNYVVPWVVITDETILEEPNGSVFVGLEYNNSLTYREWLESIDVYVQKTNQLLCGYRKELNEEMCKKYLPKEIESVE